MPAELIQLPRIIDVRGNLSFLQNGMQIPFDIRRVYWIYDVPGGETRGGHAYQTLNEVLIALSGSFDVEVDDGFSVQTYSLNRSYNALYLPPKTWRRLLNFSTNSVCMAVASAPYNEEDYIRDHNQFKLTVRNGQ